MQILRSGYLGNILLLGLIGSILACSDVEIVPRAAWSARAPETIDSIATPVKHIFISHTVTPQCHTKFECSARMRSMQNYHISIGWGDIGYNFVIGGDGRVYEGVGWRREGVHTYAWNKKSYGIAFVGNYMSVKPNDSMLRAARKLIICGINMGVIAEDRWLHGARDATCTASPGDKLYDIIKHWPRFQVHVKNDKCAALRLVPREKWHARPPFRTFLMLLPVNHVIIMHTHNYECNSLYECSRNLQFIQDTHIDQYGWWDIAYSFLIGGDGRVYEGVGWKYAAEHTVNYNTISIGVAFMGTFNNVTPSKDMLDACKNLIACGIAKGYLTPSVQISGHRDATCTRSPGDRLYAIIKKWPNFIGGRLPLYHCNSKLATLRPTED